MSDSVGLPRSVMIIDDEEFMLDLVSDMLHDLGVAEVLSAKDGEEALAKLSGLSRPPDLLICDLLMPGMDGIALLRHVCEQGYRGDIILFSGLDGGVLKAAELLAKSYSAPLLGVLGKPIDRDALAALIGRHAEHGPALRARPAGQGLSAEEIRAAIAGDCILVCYQPKVSVSDRRVVGAECLARLRHPVRGILGPETFVAEAEQYGLIDDLTLAVFRQAIAQARAWQQQGHPIKVAVNVSMHNMVRLDLPDILADIAQAKGISPASIILEVTETRLPENFVICLDILTRLRIKGFNLSIDDFGTGYSTLESLKQLPFNELKIDRAFVSGAYRDPSSRAILESSVQLGRQLHLSLVAEGVETQDEWDCVARVGCDEVQGFLVAKPMPAEAFDLWRRQWESAGRARSDPASAGSAMSPHRDEGGASDDERPLALVVDDEPFVLELVRAALSGLCRVIVAGDGESALAAMAARPPDMVIVDVEMPRLDGYETCRRIRRQSGFADLPILFLSAREAIQDQLKGYEAGGDDYMTKPFEAQVLRAKVGKLLCLAAERRQLRQSAECAASAAMTAMTSMGELGLVLETLKRFNACATYRQLAEAVLEGGVKFGLTGCVQLRAPGDCLTCADAGPVSPLELSIIRHMLGMERIVQFSTRLSISYENSTLLIKNMPVEDPERCGRLRDHLAILAEAAGVRLLGMAAEAESRRRGVAIENTIRRVSQALADIDAAQRRSRQATALTVNELVDAVERALMSTALTEEQEAFVFEIVRNGLDRIVQGQSVEADIQKRLSSIVDELDAALHRDPSPGGPGPACESARGDGNAAYPAG